MVDTKRGASRDGNFQQADSLRHQGLLNHCFACLGHYLIL